jgi:electron transfer flavoprotein alpha subunit
MRTLILVEHDNEVIHSSIHALVNAALLLQYPVVVLVAGLNCQAVAMQAATIQGVDAVFIADHACYGSQLSENVSQLVLSMAESFSVIMAASTSFGKNILPRIAASLDTAQISDVTAIIDNKTFQHPVYAGNAIETVEILDNKTLLTIRTTAFDSTKKQQEACPIEVINAVFDDQRVLEVSRENAVLTRPDLTNARIVVSGGRGLQSAEQFKLIDELADVLGAAVGASRAAVDAGFVSNDCQVGQTGKIVAPDLYIAIGISGAIQHVAGMKDAKVIVAINQDADAPIFQIATLGLVGDLFAIVPKLIEHLGSR